MAGAKNSTVGIKMIYCDFFLVVGWAEWWCWEYFNNKVGLGVIVEKIKIHSYIHVGKSISTGCFPKAGPISRGCTVEFI